MRVAPCAAQLRVAGSLRRATREEGCSVMMGGAPVEGGVLSDGGRGAWGRTARR